MAVTYLLRKRAVPYKTRLTGRLMFLRECVFERSGIPVRVKKTRVTENEGSGATRRAPRQFCDHRPSTHLQYGMLRKLLASAHQCTLVPTKAIDDVWHFHILDTQKYIEDCMELHGAVVHHFPAVSVVGRTT
jgi:hypothetical protein